MDVPGLLINYFSEKKENNIENVEKMGFPMYSDLASCGYGIEGVEDKYNVMTDHYVTITGVIHDNEVDRVWLRIQTWGKQYYILYDDFVDYNKINENLADGSIIILK